MSKGSNANQKDSLKKELSELELQKLFKQVTNGQSLQMLSYIFKVSKEFIIKFCKQKKLVLRKQYEVDYIRDMSKHPTSKQLYLQSLLNLK